jgi:dinuclear metal center YbgI/SA1388 family protein
MQKKALISYLDEYLRIGEIADYGPQGLQVEAENPEVTRLATAVDTAPPIISAAAEWGADLLLVHHGVLWRNVERIAGPLGHRVRLLLRSNIHLYAAHLALDAHPEVGNNAVLARVLGLEDITWWCEVMGTPIGVLGRTSLALDALQQLIDESLQTEARVLAFGPPTVQNLAIVSGFGADEVAEAKRLGADTLLTGETSHANFYAASDNKMNVIYAGHYATETVGVRALGRHLADRYELETRFFDFPTKM